MIKILHTADIHLDSPLSTLALRDENLRQKVQTATRSSFQKIIDLALDENVAALLISGDLYDGTQRSAKTAAFLREQLNRLREKNIAVFYIKGNHDAENPLTGSVKLPDNVKVFNGRGEIFKIEGTDVFIHGISFSNKHAPDSLLDKFQAPEPGSVNIAMLHTSLAGSAGHDNYAPCSVNDLTNLGFDYWALGHVHKRQVHSQSPFIVMPGIPQGRDIGEDGPKSVTLLTIDNRVISIEERHSAQVEFHRLEVDLTGVNNDDDVNQKIRTGLLDAGRELHSDNGILRVTLTGKTPLYWLLLRDRDVWEETVRNMAEETGNLSIEKLDFRLEEPSLDQTGAGAVDELAAMMREIFQEEGFQKQAFARMDDVIKQLPKSEREKLLPDETSRVSLAERLAQSGMQHIVALMKGAAQ